MPQTVACDGAFLSAYRWIRSYREFFRFAQASKPHDEIILLKPFSELVLINSVLKSWQIPNLALDEDLSWCWRHCDNSCHLLKYLVARPDLAELAGAAAGFFRAGYCDEKLLSFVAYLSTLPGTMCEMPSWRRYALHHAFDLMNIVPFPGEQQADSWLAQLPEPWLIAEDQAYAITHEVFYVTDFGNNPDRLSQTVRQYIEAWLPVWLRIFIQEKNADLVAELSLIAYCCRTSALAAPGINYLLSMQNPDGSLNGPRGSEHPFMNISDIKLYPGNFFSCYHTTLIALLTFGFSQRSQ